MQLLLIRYWPYLNKVAEGLPELLPLTEMRPFLSIMHAKAHTAKCEVHDFNCVLVLQWLQVNSLQANQMCCMLLTFINWFSAVCAGLSPPIEMKSFCYDILEIICDFIFQLSKQCYIKLSILSCRWDGVAEARMEQEIQWERKWSKYVVVTFVTVWIERV